MSWYFLGGFSAYLIVPSGRRWNHSGCSSSHGWSAEALSAMSRHTSMPCSRAVAHERLEVVHRAELGVDGVVAALGGADRVRHAGVVGAGDERVVAALAVLAADRVDRREVEDVEAVLGDRRDLLLDRLQAAPGAREQLVPGAEARADAVDLDRQRLGQRGGVGAQADALDGGGDLGAERRVVAGGLGQLVVAQGGDRGLERLLVGRRPWPSARPPRRSTAPSDSSPPRSCWPASILRCISSRQVANTSLQASIENCQLPGVSTVNSPSQRTPLMCASTACIGASSQRRPPGAL